MKTNRSTQKVPYEAPSLTLAELSDDIVMISAYEASDEGGAREIPWGDLV